MMTFDNSLFGMPLLAAIIFIIAGFITLKFPPKKINMLYGYRTSASMKSQERWDFAQQYAAKLMIYLGFILLVCAFIGLAFNVSQGLGVIIGVIELIILAITMFYKTEKAIKQRFTNE